MSRIYLALGGVLIGLGLYFYISNLQDKVVFLENEKATLESNLREQKSIYEDKLKQQKVVVKWKTKKVYIEKEIKRENKDEKVSDDIKSNRIYL